MRTGYAGWCKADADSQQVALLIATIAFASSEGAGLFGGGQLLELCMICVVDFSGSMAGTDKPRGRGYLSSA
jgi:hypothetical protein